MTVENFDKWLSNNFYPAMAGMYPALKGYKMAPAVEARYKELCAGKEESAFDRKLRETVYPVLAWMETNFIKDLIWRVGNRESAH